LRYRYLEVVTIQSSEKIKMADERIKPGDIVSLRSGGPRMTIASVDGQNAFCEWFTDDQQPQSRSFALASLKLDER
jgi:uncharacterized protein YodC (DUF2158 family)